MRGIFRGKTALLRRGGMAIATMGGAFILTGFAPGIARFLPVYIPAFFAILGIALLIGGMALSQK